VRRVNIHIIIMSSLVFNLMFLDGCGSSRNDELASVPVKSAPSEKPKSKKTKSSKGDLGRPAEILGLKVIAEDLGGGNSNLPDPKVKFPKKTSSESITAEGKDVHIHEKLFLRDPNSPSSEHHKNLFLVWPDQLQKVKITAADYSHRVLNEKNEWVGNFERRQAWQDPENHRWFIPISELYKNSKDYGEMDVSLADTQFIYLDLTLENGQSLKIQIQFQVVGPFPAAQINYVDFDPATAAPQFVKTVSQTGWIVRREKVVNPTSRSFQLWLRANTAPHSLNLDTYLKYPSYVLHRHSPPTGPKSNYEYSRGEMEVTHIDVIHEDGAKDSVDFKNNEWFSIVLNPNETLKLEWRAQPSNRARSCSVPQSHGIQATWQRKPVQTTPVQTTPVQTTPETRPTRVPVVLPLPGGTSIVVQSQSPFRLADLIPIVAPSGSNSTYNSASNSAPRTPKVKTRTLQIGWNLTSGRVSGAWSREIRLVHPFTSKEDATWDHTRESVDRPSIQYFILGQGSLPTDIHSSPAPARAKAFNCQGIFP
jgi:hypothetical protein